MKSIRQKRKEIKERRAQRAELHLAVQKAGKANVHEAELSGALRPNCRVNVAASAPYNSYGNPEFVERGYYVDIPFACACCGAEQVWSATQQKWWYEVAKGEVYSTAKYCRSCRRKRKSGKWRPEDAEHNFDRYLASRNNGPLPPIK